MRLGNGSIGRALAAFVALCLLSQNARPPNAFAQAQIQAKAPVPGTGFPGVPAGAGSIGSPPASMFPAAIAPLSMDMRGSIPSLAQVPLQTIQSQNMLPPTASPAFPRHAPTDAAPKTPAQGPSIPGSAPLRVIPSARAQGFGPTPEAAPQRIHLRASPLLSDDGRPFPIGGGQAAAGNGKPAEAPLAAVEKTVAVIKEATDPSLPIGELFDASTHRGPSAGLGEPVLPPHRVALFGPNHAGIRDRRTAKLIQDKKSPEALREIEFSLRMTSEQGRERSDRLLKRVDAVLVGFRLGRLTLNEAISGLSDPSLLENSGYLLAHRQPDVIFMRPPVAGEESLAASYSDSFISRPDVFPVLSPGYVMVTEPIVDDGDFLAPGYEDVAFTFFLGLAEELYHVAQHLRNSDYQRGLADDISTTISHWFSSKAHRRQFEVFQEVHPSADGDLIEADVYAKLLETLGSRNVPKGLQGRYPVRTTVDRELVELTVHAAPVR